MHTPGITNLPAFLISFVAIADKADASLAHADFFRPLSVANAAARAPLLITLTVPLPAFIAFIAFMGRSTLPRLM